MSDEDTWTQEAGSLQAVDVGLEAYLPGSLDVAWKWQPTWAKITMITHTKKGITKIRRYPDAHVDHDLAHDELVTLRFSPNE